MTIRDATSKMLSTISSRRNESAWIDNKPRVTDKTLATELEITQSTFSKLRTRTQNPDIITWAKICKMYKQIATPEEFNNLINEVL